MNFRSCEYFLTVCEMGTISAAARKLYISQQSLSQHIGKLEEELGAQLLIRANPLILTQEGKLARQMVETVLAAQRKMEEGIAACKRVSLPELTVGTLDYGFPNFLPHLFDLFLRQEPDVLLQTREFMPGEALSDDVRLYITSREIGGGYKSEALLSDRLGICVADRLLKKTYGPHWREHQNRLKAGDLSALEGCPFFRHQDTPLQAIAKIGFERNNFTPRYLPVIGSANAFGKMCIDGHAAMVTFVGHSRQEPLMPECYPIPNMPSEIPTVFICYHSNAELSELEQRFLKIIRRYFKGKLLAK
jgi:DNA-binding transcriptional LysR family regulator